MIEQIVSLHFAFLDTIQYDRFYSIIRFPRSFSDKKKLRDVMQQRATKGRKVPRFWNGISYKASLDGQLWRLVYARLKND